MSEDDTRRGKEEGEGFTGDPVVKTSHAHCRGSCSIPGWGP